MPDKAPAAIDKAKEQTINDKSDYLNVFYSKDRCPESEYPVRLARYLHKSYAPEGGRLLDMGCGRGDQLRAFNAVGFDVKGVDYSPLVQKLCAPLEAHQVDIMNEPLPFEPGSFDVVFSKSVIEHVPNPLLFLERANEALAPSGRVIIITPSWLHHGWGPFYLDHTHISPFTAPSLRDAMTMAGFKDVKVQHFRQLPFLWKSPRLNLVASLIAALPLRYSPMYDMRWPWPTEVNKLIRFSKEVMLLGVGRRI